MGKNTFQAGRLKYQRPGTVLEINGELWVLGSSAKIVAKAAQTFGLLR